MVAITGTAEEPKRLALWHTVHGKPSSASDSKAVMSTRPRKGGVVDVELAVVVRSGVTS
jgi:hypothetical protein